MARRGYRREGPPITSLVHADLRARAHYATDRATKFGLQLTRQRIRGAGLGRLAGAVGSYSSLGSGRTMNDAAYGAIFARGSKKNPEGRGNQALLAYSEGAAIYPTKGKKWLAFATKAVPKRAGRYKMTPARYKAAGLEERLGKLNFVLGKGGRVAFLVARKVVVSRRNGRILRPQGGRTRGEQKDSVIAFILIRYTKRAQRFSQRAIMLAAQREVARFAAQYRPGRPA